MQRFTELYKKRDTGMCDNIGIQYVARFLRFFNFLTSVINVDCICTHLEMELWWNQRAKYINQGVNANEE